MQTERRLHPRYLINFPVTVKLNSSGNIQTFDVESVNISKNSMEISSDGELVEALLAQEEYPPEGELSFQIPDQNHLFEVSSQLATHRRLSQHLYYLVFTFTELDEESSELLVQYIDELQLP